MENNPNLTSPLPIFFIPAYSGDNTFISIHEYIKSIETYGRNAGWTDSILIQVGKAKCVGYAASVLENDPVFAFANTWAEFKNLLIITFGNLKNNFNPNPPSQNQTVTNTLEQIGYSKFTDDDVINYINSLLQNGDTQLNPIPTTSSFEAENQALDSKVGKLTQKTNDITESNPSSIDEACTNCFSPISSVFTNDPNIYDLLLETTTLIRQLIELLQLQNEEFVHIETLLRNYLSSQNNKNDNK